MPYCQDVLTCWAQQVQREFQATPAPRRQFAHETHALSEHPVVQNIVRVDVDAQNALPALSASHLPIY